MKKFHFPSYCTILFCIFGLFAGIIPAAGAENATLDKTVFNPDDIQETFLHIAERGRYSIQAKSATGTAISLVDRMAGTLAVTGAPGERDGRIDAILEEGEYKVLLYPSPDAEKPANLAVYTFKEDNTAAKVEELPVLYDGDYIQTTLNDLSTRSYWLYFEKKEELRLELLGRSLKECSLWQNGQWLMNVKPGMSTYETASGQPMQYAEYYHTFEPGHYLLVISGGEPTPWPNESKENPLYIRRGFQYLGEAGIRKVKISPFGRDSFLVSSSSNYFECIRKDFNDTRMSTSRYQTGYSRYSSSRTAVINKESKSPFCFINGSNYGNRQILTLEAVPGDELEVRFFKSVYGTDLFYFSREEAKNSYFVAAIPSIEGENTLDLTPILIDTYDSRLTKINDQAIHISGRNPLVREVNLFGYNSIYLYIEEAGTYKIAESEEKGAHGEYRLLRVDDIIFRSNSTPYQKADAEFKVVEGFYRLEVRPIDTGILHFAFYKDRSQNVSNLLEKEPVKTVHSFVWPGIDIDKNYSSTKRLYLNSRYQTQLGLILRQLPINPNEPISFYMQGSEDISFPLVINDESFLYIEGSQFEISLSGKNIQTGTPVSPGSYTIRIKNPSKETALCSVYAYTKTQGERTPKPDLKPLTESFPILTESTPWFADFDRTETKKLLLYVQEPGLYRIETTGRLAMSVSIQTALIPSFASASENASGRNAVIARYVRPGYYLVSVTTRGRTKGRAGVMLKRTALVDEGILPVDIISRKTIPGDAALRFTLSPNEEGTYRINSFGLGIQFPYRLEDKDGFPVIKEGHTGTTINLRKEKYSFYSLPLTFESRRLTRFEKVENEQVIEGKEYILELNKTQNHVWKESNPRTPDIYKLTIPAKANIVFSLSSGMKGELVSGNEKAQALFLEGGNAESFEIEKGTYTIRIQAQEEQNLFRYSLSATTQELLPGLVYTLDSSSQTLIMSVGNDAVYDLWSFGSSDIKASLWDEAGMKLLAESDDRESDWNFRITQRLQTGRYLLKIEKVGYSSGSIQLRCDEITRVAVKNDALPVNINREIGKEVIEIPFTPAADGIFLITAKKGVSVQFAVYKGEKLCARSQDVLAVPLYKNTSYALHVWQGEDAPQLVAAEGVLLTGSALSLNDATKNISGASAYRLSNPLGLAYSFSGKDASVYFSPGYEHQCQPLSQYAVPVSDNGFLVSVKNESISEVAAVPLKITSGKPATVFIEDIGASFLLESANDQVFLVEAETQGLPPGVFLMPKSMYNTDQIIWTGVELTGNTSYTTAATGGKYQGKVWNLSAYTGGVGLRVNLKVTGFAVQSEKRLAMGETGLYSIEAGKSVRVILGKGTQELHLLLEKGCGAGIWNSGNPLGIGIAGHENRELRITVDGGIVAIMNTGKQTAAARLSTVSADQPRTFKVESPARREIVVNDEGKITVNVIPKPGDDVLCVAGDVYTVSLRGDDGNIYRGQPGTKELPFTTFPAKAGELVIEHTAGFVGIWFSKKEHAAANGVDVLPMTAKQIQPGVTTLTNASAHLNFTMKASGFAVFRINASGVFGLMENGNAAIVSFSATAEERVIVKYLDAGTYQLDTRPIDSIRQEGTIHFQQVLPKVFTGEDREAAYFIGKNEMQAFRFSVSAKATVGVGVSTDSDQVNARLYDKKFTLLGEGQLLFRELEEGEYFLLVYGKDKPVRFSPLVYGNEGMITEVPQEVIDEYKK